MSSASLPRTQAERASHNRGLNFYCFVLSRVLWNKYFVISSLSSFL